MLMLNDKTSQFNTCAFITLGCKVNQYDTQAIREQLLARGLVEVDAGAKADLYVVNTCTVTASGDAKGRKYIRRLARQNPHALLIVTGCSVDSDGDLASKLDIEPERLLLVGNDRKADIPALLFCEPGEIDVSYNTWDTGIAAFEGHTRAFIKIEDGCDNFCAYCIVPYVRGRVRSRPIDSIIEEAHRLADAGHREIVLTGIHLGAYGRGSDHDLADVVERLDAVPGIRRLRLSSIEAVEVTDRLIGLASGGGKLCPHFHLPLQSGSDNILQRMNRRYSARDFLDIVDRISGRISRPSVTTDVLLGFPGETEADYLATEAICRSVQFSRTHIFPFSPREGTPAASMSDQCIQSIVGQRAERLAGVAAETALTYAGQFVGESAEVLVESVGQGADGQPSLCGYTDRYVKVLFDGPESSKGRLVNVRIDSADGEGLHGARNC